MQLGTLPAGFIPSYNVRIAGHQWIFANSTDDIPLIARVATDGKVYAGGVTWLTGNAFILFNTTWII